MSLRAVVFTALATFAMLPTFSSVIASAGEGPRRTVLRPVDVGEEVVRHPTRSAPRRELILFVGGIGSHSSDTTFDELMKTYFGDPRFDVRRLGGLPEHPYDSLGGLDAAAAELVSEIRALGPGYTAVHIVAHSMGGAVVDRAIGRGLSHDDGVVTYVALASPHHGSLAAQLGQGVIALEGDGFPAFRRVIGMVQDPGSAASADLAAVRPVAPPPGVARLDLRMSSDAVVLRRDADDPGVESRVLLPTGRLPLQGHGGITHEPEAVALVRATIDQRRVPPDERGLTLRAAAESDDVRNGTLVACGLFVFASICAVAALDLRRRRLVRRAEVRTAGAMLDRAKRIARGACRAVGSVWSGALRSGAW